MLVAQAGLVSPDLWKMAAITLISASVLLGGLVTASKGRWGWLLVGLVLGGVIWPFTALLPASPRSVWRRFTARRSSLREPSIG